MTKKNDDTVSAKAGNDLSKAKESEASGAIAEPEITKVPDHPSVDNNPRAGVPAESNQIDFNTPSAIKPAREQVEDNLKAED